MLNYYETIKEQAEDNEMEFKSLNFDGIERSPTGVLFTSARDKSEVVFKNDEKTEKEFEERKEEK
jgi:hypothetical protein